MSFFLKKPSALVLTGFDHVTEAKGEFILNQGLKGFALWDAGSDHDDLLLDAICEGAKLGSS